MAGAQGMWGSVKNIDGGRQGPEVMGSLNYRQESNMVTSTEVVAPSGSTMEDSLGSLQSLPYGSEGKKSAHNKKTWVWSLGWEDPLEKEMATHSSILAWKVPRTEERGRLQSTGHKE